MIFQEHTVLENLQISADIIGLRRSELKQRLEFVYDLFPHLIERSSQLAGSLSGGEQQMLAIGRGLIAKPKVMLLDEPSLGLAPIIVQEIFGVLKKLKENGLTILLVEQNVQKALEFSDRTYVLELGSVIKEGLSGELLHDPSIIDSYLGKRRKVV